MCRGLCVGRRVLSSRVSGVGAVTVPYRAQSVSDKTATQQITDLWALSITCLTKGGSGSQGTCRSLGNVLQPHPGTRNLQCGSKPRAQSPPFVLSPDPGSQYVQPDVGWSFLGAYFYTSSMNSVESPVALLSLAWGLWPSQ